jgi:hypothetical protein
LFFFNDIIGAIRLLLNDANMEDDKSVGELKVDNDRVVFMVFKKDGSGFDCLLCTIHPVKQAPTNGSQSMFTTLAELQPSKSIARDSSNTAACYPRNQKKPM